MNSAWVPGFQYDIFLSYAWVDNATVDPTEEGWVTQFHKHLEVTLSQKIGRLNVVKIWRDTRKIQGHQIFDRTIEEALRGSAVLVALDSRGYGRSEYCRGEIESFNRKAQGEPQGLVVGDRSRIFHVLLNNLEAREWPSEVGKTAGFPFHDALDQEMDGEPLAPSGEMFRKRIRELAKALCGTLEKMAEGAGVRPTEVSANRLSVFVAETADSLSRTRKVVIRELEQSAGIVISAARIPPPYEANEHDAAVRREVEAADLSVHLFDKFPGREIEGAEGSSYPRRQAEVAIQHGKSQLIWVPLDLSPKLIEDEQHAAFLDRLENQPRGSARYDFQRESPGAIGRAVLAKVKEMQDLGRQAESAPPAKEAALLDTHFKDQLHAFELSQYLIRHDVQPYINPHEDDPSKNLDFFTERLRQVGMLILFYGAVSEEWLCARLVEAVKIAIVQKCPLRACGVYVAPPRKPGDTSKHVPPVLPVEWMDHTRGFNPRAVDGLIARARAGAGRR